LLSVNRLTVHNPIW